jgi:hypothetical protein
MRVVVTGATGLIGGAVTRLLRSRGEEVIALSRDRDRAQQKLGSDVEVHEWREPKAEPPPAAALEGADAVINLLGERIARRWNDTVKREIRDSRVLSTRLLVAALAALPEGSGPKTLVSTHARMQDIWFWTSARPLRLLRVVKRARHNACRVKPAAPASPLRSGLRARS